jgi:predicted HTH domain antitoxin
MQVVLEIPDDVARSLPLPQEERRQRLQTEMACLLYSKGWLSFGQAVRVSGCDYYRFGIELGDRNIPRQMTEADVDHDLAYADRQQHVSHL